MAMILVCKMRIKISIITVQGSKRNWFILNEVQFMKSSIELKNIHWFNFGVSFFFSKETEVQKRTDNFL